MVDIDSIPHNSIIIDCGLGEDISFCEELLKIRKVRIIGFDPTEKAERYIKNKQIDLEYYKLAINKDGQTVKIYKNTTPTHVSESINPNHNAVGTNYYIANAISINEIRKLFNNISLIKMDIEGAEYELYDQCFGIKQICIEFHHHCIKHISITTTEQAIDAFQKAGYTIIANNQSKEITFLWDK